MSHGDRMDRDNLAVVAILPEPKLIHGELSKRDMELVSKWVRLNQTALMGSWDGTLGGTEFARALQTI